jgi:PhzF family phenazine biosynthesis protein
VSELKPRPFHQVDVFTATPYLGNGLAVVLDGSGLSDEAMLRFCNWTQLSEAAFLLPPTQAGADYKVRIFSPGRELPFAGHPTLGSCHAWLQAGGQPQAEFIVQECGVGLVRIRQESATTGTRLAFAAPPRKRSGPLDADELARITQALNLRDSDVQMSAWCDNGPPWRGLLLRDAAQVLALQPQLHLLQGLDVGVVGAHPAGSACQFEVRAFFTASVNAVGEDAVTGSLNAALAQWLMAAGVAPQSYIAAQGTCLGRAGRVHVQKLGQDIWIGGDSVTCIEGQVLL